MMDTYLRSSELTEIASLLDALNGPLLDNIHIDGPVCLGDANGDCAGYVLNFDGEGYVFVADPEVIE